MELSFKSISLIIAILLTGLSAGLFYAWQVSVIPGTKGISDRSYLETMQSVNRAILNPAFFIVFFGSLLSLAVGSYMQYRAAIDITFWLILGATLSYLIGTFGVTVFGNVPLNESLDRVNLTELNGIETHQTRAEYETKWNLWHSVRTVFSILAFALSVLAVYMNQYREHINL